MTIGEYLKDLRTQKGLSTKKASELSSGRISQPYIVQVEKGDKTPSVAKLEAFADVYGVSIHDIIDVMVDIDMKVDMELPIVLSVKEKELIKKIRAFSDKKKQALWCLLLE